MYCCTDLYFLVLIVISSTIINAGQSPVRTRNYFPEENGRPKASFLLTRNKSGHVRLDNLSVNSSNTPLVPPSDLTVYFYSTNNLNNPVIFTLDSFNGTIPSEHFNPALPIFMCTHGYRDDCLSSNQRLVKNSILSQGEVNYFLLDWRVQAELFYIYAVDSIPEVGRLFAEVFLKQIMEKYEEVSLDNVTLCGQSLGAHVVGAMGAQLGGQVSRIIGLDPALPLFHMDSPETRLDPTDGKYVQVIHSNGGLQGFRSSIGHVDYFPNGRGMHQPGCGSDYFGSCAHERALRYYAESVKTNGFTSHRCDSYENYLEGKCNAEPTSYLGHYELDISAEGDYYLQTSDKSPFSLN